MLIDATPDFHLPMHLSPMFSSLRLPKSVERTSVLGAFSSSTPPPASGDDGVGVCFTTLFFILHSPFLCPFSLLHHLYGPSPWTPPTFLTHLILRSSLPPPPPPQAAWCIYSVPSRFSPPSARRLSRRLPGRLSSVVLDHCRRKGLGIGVKGLGRSAR